MADAIQRSLLLWGCICLVGFGVFQFWNTSVLAMNITLAVLWIVGFILVQFWVKEIWKTPVLYTWGLLALIGLVLSFAFEYHWIPVQGILSPLVSLWLVLFIIGFLGTQNYTKERVWLFIAALPLLVLIGIWIGIPTVSQYSYLLLGITSGIPLILMSFKY